MAAIFTIAGAFITADTNPKQHPSIAHYLAYFLLLWVVISFGIACFLTWQKKCDQLQDALQDLEAVNRRVSEREQEIRDKTSGLISLRSELDAERSKNTPNLEPLIGRPLLYGPDNPATGISLMFTMQIKNVPPCSPSAAIRYRVTAEKRDVKVTYIFEKINEPLNISGPLPGGTSWTNTIYPEDSLIERSTQPIPVGGITSGWLVAFLKHFKTRHELDGAKLTVDFEDITGKLASASWVAEMDKIGLDPSLPIIAGIKSVYKEQKQPPQS